MSWNEMNSDNSILDALMAKLHDVKAVRAAVVGAVQDSRGMEIEYARIEDWDSPVAGNVSGTYERVIRRQPNEDQFNVAMVIPTGLGCDVGGHAGDAGPVAKMLGQVCDTLILHPNVVNASDVNELPGNAMYVEGSVLARLLAGNVGIRKMRTNRVLTIIDCHAERIITDLAINSANAATTTCGFPAAGIVVLGSPIEMNASVSPTGRAVGSVGNLEETIQVLRERAGTYDAVALLSPIHLEDWNEIAMGYFEKGEGVNPWGGVEAILTHTLTTLCGKPVVHAPMIESVEVSNQDTGIVDPRLAAECCTETYAHCLYRGLMNAPAIVPPRELLALRGRPDVITVDNIHALVMPDNCVGIPNIAARAMGIPLILVRDEGMVGGARIDDFLGFDPGMRYHVDNYMEAAGVLACLRAGMNPASCRRPLAHTVIERKMETKQLVESLTKEGD